MSYNGGINQIALMKGRFVLSDLAQPPLFEFNGDTTTGALELFPLVWSALEGLTSLDVVQRNQALDNLLEIQAPRLSPLVAYILVTRLQDVDVNFRARVIKVLADVLSPDEKGNPASEEVRQKLLHHLSQIRRRTMYAILQVCVEGLTPRSDVSVLLNACPYAGNALADILGDRKTDMALRKEAAYFIADVGFLDAVPELERIRGRLESRQNGQRSMAFLPPALGDEAELLPDITKALQLLVST